MRLKCNDPIELYVQSQQMTLVLSNGFVKEELEWVAKQLATSTNCRWAKAILILHPT